MDREERAVLGHGLWGRVVPWPMVGSAPALLPLAHLPAQAGLTITRGVAGAALDPPTPF